MESKDSGKSKSRTKNQRDSGAGKRSKSADSRLVYRAKMPDAQLRRIIRCYAEGKIPAEAQRECGVSHVTAYRVYQQVRERLIHAGLYIDPDQWLAATQADETTGPYFDWKSFERQLAQAMGKHRGIRSANRHAYAAQEIFQLEEGRRYTPAQLYRLIILAIKAAGPLNRPPRPLAPSFLHRELARLMISDLNKKLRQSPLGVRAKIGPKVAALQRNIDRFTIADNSLSSESDNE